ncbi:hypothetical protein [Nesterenkonia pannonica]|uniref:hypothetical protein n=1 Tax=Nesterenkonia pannonica TaxID=1548602 RepID=UPI0021643F6B|nr:hypothetical protein [Nesterenkonia pannonica]
MPTASAVLSSVGRRLAQDPWTQAAVIGPLSVIPARTYPQWLRRTLIWGPTASVAAMAAAPGATTWVLHKLSAWQGEPLDTTELPELTPAARTAYALTAGTATYLGLASASGSTLQRRRRSGRFACPPRVRSWEWPLQQAPTSKSGPPTGPAQKPHTTSQTSSEHRKRPCKRVYGGIRRQRAPHAS